MWAETSRLNLLDLVPALQMPVFFFLGRNVHWVPPQASVAYFDESDGAAKYRLLVGGQLVDEWTADDTLPDNKPNGHTSTRRETSRVALRPGDLIRIEATADGGEWAAIDYLEIDPAGN